MLTMRTWVLSIALGIAIFNATPAQADVPQQVIDQIADLRVQETELRHLTAIGKLTGADAVTKQQAIEAQIRTLYLPYRTVSPAEDTSARAAIDRLVADKLSLLRPQWIQEEGAAVVLDVKGEIYEQTSKWRRENVGPVYKFSPLDPAASHGYNPLAEVRADPDYLWEDARFLADMMIVPSGAKDPFWEHRARDVLTAAIARVCIEEDVAKRSMGDVLDILHGVGWDKFVTYLEARVDFPSMTRAGHSLASMEPKTRDGVLQSALSSMSAWDGERIARATRKSDWSPLDLRGGENPTIYICFKPNEVDSYISVLRVFIAQHIRSLTSTVVPAHGVQPILFILDELPRLRHMPPVEEALEIGRQYGIKLWLFAQSLGQLREAYPPSRSPKITSGRSACGVSCLPSTAAVRPSCGL
jgi:type IV secretory pathway TraG/TraD family ATPase VirD4